MNTTDKLQELAELAKSLGFPVEQTSTSVKVIVADGQATGECFIRAHVSNSRETGRARVVYTQRVSRSSSLNRKQALEAVASWAA
jgi:hypothetical protein